MILKLLGSMIVISFSAFLGYIFSRECQRRPQELRELQMLLQMFENEISYLSSVLADAFETVYKSAGSGVGLFFGETVQLLQKEKTLSACEAWKLSVEKNIKNTSLNREDQDILISFGKILGNSDIDGQVKNIKLTLNKLKLQEQKAEDARLRNEKMYKSLGFLGGVAVVIILV